MLKFTQDHEWLKIEGDTATVGITDHAATQLGDLVFIELPKLGSKLTKGSATAVVESVKTASDVYAPMDGEVVAVNQAVADDPTIVSADPFGGGWLYKLKFNNAADLDALMNEQAYRATIG